MKLVSVANGLLRLARGSSVTCVFVLWIVAGDVLAEPVTFAVMGDYGTGADDEEHVAEMIHGWNLDFVITAGDNNYGQIDVGHSDWEVAVGQFYGRYIKRRGDRAYPYQTSTVQRFFPAAGNHDVEPDFSAPTGASGGLRPGYLDYFHYDPLDPAGRLPPGVHEPEHSFYDFRWGDVHLFVLDSDAVESSDASRATQMQWLEQRLAESDAAWKFVYLHHPPFSSSSHGDHLRLQWPYDEWGADAVFSAHDHTYERIVVGDFPYFVTGTGGQFLYSFGEPVAGSQLRYNESHGAMRVTVDPQAATFEFFATEPELPGQVSIRRIDRYVLNKPVPEASTLVLAATGMVVLAAGRRRRTARSPPPASPIPPNLNDSLTW